MSVASAFPGAEHPERRTEPLDKARAAPTLPEMLDRVGLEFISQGGPSYIADGGGKLLWGNADWGGFVTRLGRVAETPIDQLPWPADRLIDLARAEGGPFELQESMETGRGREIVCSRHWLIEDAQGGVIGLAGCVEEPSFVGKLRQQVSDLQDRLDDVVRLTSDWTWEVDPEGTLTLVSARVTETLGYHPREMVGRNLLEFGQFVDERGIPIAGPLSVDRPHSFRDSQFTAMAINNTARALRFSAVPVFDRGSGRFKGYRGTGHDVTEETRALGLVRSSQQRLDQALDAVSEGFVLFDDRQRLVLYNRQFIGLYPRAARALVYGLRYAEMVDIVVDAGDLASVTTVVAADRDLEARAVGRHGVEFQITDGRWIRATVRQIPGGGIVGIYTDITEIKARERALIESKAAAEAANRSKSDFLSNISHELRTPLNAIIGFSEVILSEPMGPIGAPQYKDYLGDVLQSGRHLLDTINDIIDVSKAEAGTLELREELTEINPAVDAAIRTVHEGALRGNVRLLREVDRNLPLLRADPRKLRQILRALISNAVKFTPPGGTVSIGCRRKPEGGLLITIADNGVGMAAESIPAAMSPFGVIDGALNRQHAGTGLGLPLTRAMVELHQGRLELTSRPGAGTTATIELPEERLAR